MSYKITSRVFGVLDFKENNKKLEQYGDNFIVNNLNDELLQAKEEKWIMIEEVESENKIIKKEEEKKYKEEKYKETKNN